MTVSVDFYFDVGSPASYLAWTQLPALCRRADAHLRYRPILLGGVFQATGNTSPAMVPAKGRYMLQDLARFAKRYGVQMKFNPHFPIMTLPLMRILMGAQLRQPERFEACLAAAFHAIWVEGLNMNDAAIVIGALARAGFAPELTQGWAEDPEVKAALKANTEEAVQRGVFGAPTMFVGDDMYFGQDRLDFVAAALGVAGKEKAVTM